MKIKSRFTGSILFESKHKTIKATVVAAIDTEADLTRANLYRANLAGADLTRANLYRANLAGANLAGADLTRANLYGANLAGANLYRANLAGADLTRANLYGAIGFTFETYARFRACPPSGEFIAWKKGHWDAIIKLKIPWFARRCNAIGSRKCRSEMAIVLGIERDGKAIKECGGWNSRGFRYRVGEMVWPDSYDPSWYEECSHGIHFFMTRQEAEDL